MHCPLAQASLRLRQMKRTRLRYIGGTAAGEVGIARESMAITVGGAGIARHTAITVGLGRVFMGGWAIAAAGGDAELPSYAVS